MDQIPVEILAMIFERLPVSQLDECRCVCKKWLTTIDCLMNFDCLVVYTELPPVNQTFFHNYEKVNLRYSINLYDFSEPSEFKKRIYRKFRRIYIIDHFKTFRYTNEFHHFIKDFRETGDSPFSSLQNSLTNLKQLKELHLCLHKSWLWAIGKLSLPNLETLKLIRFRRIHFFEKPMHLVLDTPQLTNLSITSPTGFELMHPQTIETLEIQENFVMDPECFFNSYFKDFLMSLSGLQRLLIEYGEGLDRETQPENEVLEFLRDRVSEIHFLGIYHVSEELGRSMREMKKQAKQIRVYFNGLEVDCLRDLLNRSQQERDKFFGWGLRTSDQRNLYLSNRSALSQTLPFYEVNYDLIEELAGNDAGLLSSERLPKLEVVTVRKQVDDELALGRWLSKSNTLIEILFRCPLSAEFYSNTLPISCPTLQGLNFVFNAPMDFTFLLKFKFLYRVDLTSSDYDLVELLFTKLTYLRYLAFYHFKCKSTKRKRRLSLGVVKKLYTESVNYEIKKLNEQKVAYEIKKQRWDEETCVRTCEIKKLNEEEVTHELKKLNEKAILINIENLDEEETCEIRKLNGEEFYEVEEDGTCEVRKLDGEALMIYELKKLNEEEIVTYYNLRSTKYQIYDGLKKNREGAPVPVKVFLCFQSLTEFTKKFAGF